MTDDNVAAGASPANRDMAQGILSGKVAAAYERWRRARVELMTAQPRSAVYEDDDPLLVREADAIRALAAVPARTPTDLLAKLLPLAIAEHGELIGQRMFEASVPAEDSFQESDLWRGLIADLSAYFDKDDGRLRAIAG